MRVNGKKINSTGRAWKLGLMALHIKVSMKMVKSMVQANSLGLINQLIQDNSLRTTFKDMVFISGQTGAYTKENGATIRWKAEGNSSGLTVANT